MFRRVVTNFRKRTEKTRKSMRNSITTSSEFANENDLTKKFSAKFFSDDSLNSVLSVYDNNSNSSESELNRFDVVNDFVDSNSEGIKIYFGFRS